jgi:hypothetical protein
MKVNKAITGIMALALVLALGVGMVENAEAQDAEERFFNIGELCGYALGAVYDLICLPALLCSLPLNLISRIPLVDSLLHLAILFDLGLFEGISRITQPYILGRYLNLLFEGLGV